MRRQCLCAYFTECLLKVYEYGSHQTFFVENIFFFLNAKYQIRISNDLPYFNKQWSVPELLELLEHYNSVGI